MFKQDRGELSWHMKHNVHQDSQQVVLCIYIIAMFNLLAGHRRISKWVMNRVTRKHLLISILNNLFYFWNKEKSALEFYCHRNVSSKIFLIVIVFSACITFNVFSSQAYPSLTLLSLKGDFWFNFISGKIVQFGGNKTTNINTILLKVWFWHKGETIKSTHKRQSKSCTNKCYGKIFTKLF